MKYIDADKLIAEIAVPRKELPDTIEHLDDEESGFARGQQYELTAIEAEILCLKQEQQMPDSAQLIAEWEKEKEVLEQKDFRGDAERMAYNAFLDGFVKGLGYEGTK